MRTTRKILILVAVVAVMVAALVVSTSAYISWDAETSSFPNGENSSYADINAPGWIQVAGTTTALDANGDTDYDDEGDLPKGNGSYRMYFNESTGTLVVEMKNDGESITGGNTDYTKAAHSSYWLNANAAKITTLEIRNVGHLNLQWLHTEIYFDNIVNLNIVRSPCNFAVYRNFTGVACFICNRAPLNKTCNLEIFVKSHKINPFKYRVIKRADGITLSARTFYKKTVNYLASTASLRALPALKAGAFFAGT